MKIVSIKSFGGPEVLAFEEVSKPQPEAGEVLIKVFAASVNPIDYKIRSGEFQPPGLTLPTILGRDCSGLIDALGEGVTDYAVGDEVYAFLASRSGGYAEYVLARLNEVAPKPLRVDHLAAAAVPLAAMTAYQGLFRHGGLQTEQRVLIHGASGGVGHFAVQFAKAAGAYVIATARGEDSVFLNELGADHVIDHRKTRFEEAVGEVDLVLDLIGGETQERSFSVIKPGGALVSVLKEPSKERAAELGIRVVAFRAEAVKAELSEIGRLIDSAEVRPIVAAVLPFAEIRRAHEMLEHEHLRGKLVLAVVPETAVRPSVEQEGMKGSPLARSADAPS